MTSEEQMKFSQRYARFNRQPQGLFGKLLTLVLGAAFLVLAFMFSIVALAIAAVGGLMLWGWIWWKTRALRQQLRDQATNYHTQSVTEGEAKDGDIIEGEAIRTADDPEVPVKLLR
jgi:hypothetical protein